MYCNQFGFLTHLRLRQWRCSRLCWCPACKEAVVSEKWFAHWQCILCWQSPAAFTVWWINPVDRLTCCRCDMLQKNILKQLLKSHQEVTWNWFPSTPREVQNLAYQKIEQCTKQMNQINVRNAFDYGRLDAQTSQAGFVQQQCYCKDIAHADIRESARVNYWVGSQNPARTSSNWMYELWISDDFEWFFAVNILYPKFVVLARCKQLMPVTEVSIRFLGQPAFQLPMFPKCDNCRKEVCSTCLSKESIPAILFLQRHSAHADIRESARVNYWVGSHNPARTSSNWMFELWISDGFQWFFAVNILYPKFAVLARCKQLMPVTEVSFRFFGLWSKNDLLWHLSMSAPCFHVARATKQWRIVEIEFLAMEGWKWGGQPFSCPCSLKESKRDVCLRNPCFWGNLSLHSLPEAWAPPALHYGWIMLAKDRVVVSTLWITGYSLWSRLSYICDCCKSMKTRRDSAFSLSGSSVGLWALWKFATCDARTAERRFVRHVCLRNPFLQLLLEISIIHSLPEAGSW